MGEIFIILLILIVCLVVFLIYENIRKDFYFYDRNGIINCDVNHCIGDKCSFVDNSKTHEWIKNFYLEII